MRFVHGEHVGRRRPHFKATLALLGLGESLAGLYAYAILATAVAVIVLIILGRMAARIGGEAHFTREAEG